MTLQLDLDYPSVNVSPRYKRQMQDSILDQFTENERKYIVSLVYPVILKTLRKFVDDAYASGQIIKTSPKASQHRKKKSAEFNLNLYESVLKSPKSETDKSLLDITKSEPEVATSQQVKKENNIKLRRASKPPTQMYPVTIETETVVSPRQESRQCAHCKMSILKYESLQKLPCSHSYHKMCVRMLETAADKSKVCGLC